MAAFSFPNPSFLMDPFFFPQLCPSEAFHEVYIDEKNHERSYLDHNSMVALSNNEPSITKKQNTESSTVIDKLESGEQVTQKLTQMNKKRTKRNGSFLNSVQSKDERQNKSKKQRKSNEEEHKKLVVTNEIDQEKAKEEPSKDYIHVRARRGQATDSHSLAERVRREKISERMEMLQKLVPGCDKVTGKALILEEIINYIQSLQNQVEFLSMKLTSMNPMSYDFEMDLDELMVRPQEIITTTTTVSVSPMSSQPQQFTNYPLLDSSTSVLLQQEQCPNTMFQEDNGCLLWNAEDQRQHFLNTSEFSNNLCSFK